MLATLFDVAVVVPGVSRQGPSRQSMLPTGNACLDICMVCKGDIAPVSLSSEYSNLCHFLSQMPHEVLLKVQWPTTGHHSPKLQLEQQVTMQCPGLLWGWTTNTYGGRQAGRQALQAGSVLT